VTLEGGFGLEIGFIGQLYTQLVTTSNYGANANLHTLQFTATHTQSFLARSVFTSSCLITALTIAIPLLPGSIPPWMAAIFQLNWLRVRVTLRLAVYRQSVRLGDKPLETHDQRLFFQLNPCGQSAYVTSSLTRRWFCCLQLLLVLASAVILGSESRGTHDHILRSQIRDSPTWRARSPYLYPPGTGWPSYTPRHWVPFSSPPTTRRATVEVFEPASTRRNWIDSPLRPAYNSSARTAVENTFLFVVCWFVAVETCLFAIVT
jgi:hypothetical protein